jgi:fatty acid desaturase
MAHLAMRREYREAAPNDPEDLETPRNVIPTTGVPETSRAERMQAGEVGVHPAAVEIAVAATIWFLAVTWLAFASGPEIDYLLVIVTLFFVIFFTLFLLTASYSLHDKRWPVRDTSLREFLNSTVSTATGDERGRDVLIEVALVPVSLALAATLIGLVRAFLS